MKLPDDGEEEIVVGTPEQEATLIEEVTESIEKEEES